MTKRRDDYSYDGYGDFGSYGPPIRRKDGIQSRNQRGAFASKWWAKRWLSVLESYGIGSRLERGRSYARSGQVLNVDIEPGLVRSKVQGSRPKPYDVRLMVAMLSEAEWARVLDAISGQAIFAAQLLDGEMPQEIESAFEAANVPLFPQTADDIDTDCSCPDMANPCKHIAAVYYLLGEQFDLDPFLIFKLRGRTRDQVIEGLRARRAAAVGQVDVDAEIAAEPPVPLLVDQIADYWGDGGSAWVLPTMSEVGRETDALRRLGTPPGEARKPLEAVYHAMSEYVLNRLLGQDSDTVE